MRISSFEDLLFMKASSVISASALFRSSEGLLLLITSICSDSDRYQCGYWRNTLCSFAKKNSFMWTWPRRSQTSPRDQDQGIRPLLWWHNTLWSTFFFFFTPPSFSRVKTWIIRRIYLFIYLTSACYFWPCCGLLSFKGKRLLTSCAFWVFWEIENFMSWVIMLIHR